MTPQKNGSQSNEKVIEAFSCVAASTIDINLIEEELESFVEYDLEEELYLESYMPLVCGQQVSDELE